MKRTDKGQGEFNEVVQRIWEECAPDYNHLDFAHRIRDLLTVKVPKEDELLSAVRLINPDGWAVHYKNKRARYMYGITLEQALIAAVTGP